MEEVSRLKVGDIGDIEGGQGRRQETNQETFDTPPTPDNTDRVNNLHGETQETNHKTKEGKKDTTGDTPEDIGDRTQGTPETDTLLLLRDTIAILKEQLDRQDKQIKDMTNTMQFALKEVSEYRQMLALPNPVKDSKEGEVVNVGDIVGDITPETQGTQDRGHIDKKVVNKTKKDRGHRGHNHKPKQKAQQKQTPKQEVKQVKKENKKRGLFSWIFR